MTNPDLSALVAAWRSKAQRTADDNSSEHLWNYHVLVEKLADELEAALAARAEHKDTCEYYKICIEQEFHFRNTLAKILGYPYDEEYGWVTGDHVADSLLLELERKFASDKIDEATDEGGSKPQQEDEFPNEAPKV